MTHRKPAASVLHAMDVDHHPTPRERSGQARGEMAGMDQGMRVLSYLIGGILLYGGLGWVGDHYLGTSFLLPIGIVLGAAGGCYVIIRRYGQVPDATRAAVATDGPAEVQGTANHKREGAR